MKRLIVFIVLIVLAGLFPGTPAVAQPKLDSVITASTLKIYDRPFEVIAAGNTILEEATSPSTKANAHMLLAGAYLSVRENDKALNSIIEAGELLDQISNPEIRIRILNRMGMQYQQLRIFDRAIEYLDDALLLINSEKDSLKIAEEAGYNYAVRGFIYRERMNCDIAITYLNKAIAQYSQKSSGNRAKANISTLLYNKGNCYLQLAQVDSAQINFLNSVHYAEEIKAKSLVAFAKKGLSEVYTFEGKFREAIQVLEEAEAASSEVGDLILNQGIYNNLSENFLAVNDWEKYQFYYSKFKKTQAEIETKENKTINNSITKLIEEGIYEQKQELRLFKTVNIFLLACAVGLAVVLCVFLIKKWKNLRKIQSEVDGYFI